MKKELKKQAILVAAQRLFVEKGYNDASLQMIADEVGTTRSNILYHYKSKAALFEIILKDWEDEWVVTWERIKAGKCHPSVQLQGFFHVFIYEDLRHPLRKAFDEFLGDADSKQKEKERWVECDQESIAFILSRGVSEGYYNIETGQMNTHVNLIVGSLYGMSDTMRQESDEQIMSAFKLFLEIYLKKIETDVNGFEGGDNE